MKHFCRSLFAMLLVLSVLLNVALADDTATYADATFVSASCTLGLDKTATFSLTTLTFSNRILVSNVWLEQKVDNKWVYVKSLAVPATVATNTISYYASISYASAITTKGTFRIGFTADADGSRTTRYSGSQRY